MGRSSPVGHPGGGLGPLLQPEMAMTSNAITNRDVEVIATSYLTLDLLKSDFACVRFVRPAPNDPPLPPVNDAHIAGI